MSLETNVTGYHVTWLTKTCLKYNLRAAVASHMNEWNFFLAYFSCLLVSQNRTQVWTGGTVSLMFLYLQTRSFYQSGFISVQLRVNHALYQSAVAGPVQQGAEPLVAPPPFFKPLLPECVERLWLRLSSPHSLIRAQRWRRLLCHGVDLRLQSLSQRSSAEPRPLKWLHVMWHGQEVTQSVQEVQQTQLIPAAEHNESHSNNSNSFKEIYGFSSSCRSKNNLPVNQTFTWNEVHFVIIY